MIDNQEISFEDAGDAGDSSPIRVLIEGIDEIPAEEPKDPSMKFTKEELVAQLAETRKSLESERERTLEVGALRTLAEELKNQPRPSAPGYPQPTQPGETEEEFKTKFNTKFYDSPYDTMMEFQQKKLAPEVQRIMGANLLTSRKFLLIDPDRKETAAKYMAEIDAEMDRIAPQTKLYDPDIYAKAHDLVASRHVRDIVDARVKEAMEAAGKAPASTNPTRPNYSERGTGAPTGAGPRTVILTHKENETRLTKGLSKENYAAFLGRHPEARQK